MVVQRHFNKIIKTAGESDGGYGREDGCVLLSPGAVLLGALVAQIHAKPFARIGAATFLRRCQSPYLDTQRLHTRREELCLLTRSNDRPLILAPRRQGRRRRRADSYRRPGRIVVIRMTPLAPRTPYNAGSTGSFSTTIDSMSYGEMPRSAPPGPASIGVPSSTYSGSLLPKKDVKPRIRTEMPDPVRNTETPATRPSRIASMG